MRDQIRDLLTELDEDDTIALVRCEAKKPYNGQDAVHKLQKLKLVSSTSWSCTELGKEVVAWMCGLSYSYTAPGLRPDGTKKMVFATREQAMPAFAQRDCLCTGCAQDITRGHPGFWIQGEGFFHENCVEVSA